MIMIIIIIIIIIITIIISYQKVESYRPGVHPDDQTQPFEMTPGFKPFTIIL